MVACDHSETMRKKSSIYLNDEHILNVKGMRYKSKILDMRKNTKDIFSIPITDFNTPNVNSDSEVNLSLFNSPEISTSMTAVKPLLHTKFGSVRSSLLYQSIESVNKTNVTSFLDMPLVIL